MTTPPNQSLTFRSSLTRFCSLLLLCLSTWLPTALWAQPTGFVDQLFMGGWNNVVGMTFDENGRIYVYEKAGRVLIVDNGVRLPNPLIDISEEVGDWRDFGMLGFVLDPNFLSNGYIYLQYTVDRHHLLYHGTNDYDPNANEYFSATIGRITRYTANPAAGLTSVDYASRLVLLGETKETGVPSLHQSHGIGGLIFGTDGTLLACAGDGASYSSVDEGSASETYYAQALADGIIRPDENVGAYRCQQLTSLDGKILRLDPATGDGIASNPFYDGNAPRSAQSRVWSLGVRNPYRISKKPHTGSHFPGDGNPGVFYFGDVGWGNREELNIITTGGQNFGWPKYEGMTHQPGYNNAAYAPGSHERPVVDWRNTTPRALVDGTIYNVGSAQVPGPNFNGNASTGGVFYEGHDFPAEYHDTYFHADYGADWIRHFTFDTNNNPTGISDFVSNGGPIVFVASNHDYDGLFYVRYPSQIRRVVYTGSDNRPPVAQLAVDRDHGPSPLGIQFTGDQSFDPEFQSLSYAWDFGDGNTSSAANPFHTFSTGGGSPAQFTVSLTVSDPQGNTDQKSQVISLNNTTPVIVSTSLDNWSNFDPSTVSNLALNAVVTDAEHNANQLTWEWLTSLYHNDHHHDEPVVDELLGRLQRPDRIRQQRLRVAEDLQLDERRVEQLAREARRAHRGLDVVAPGRVREDVVARAIDVVEERLALGRVQVHAPDRDRHHLGAADLQRARGLLERRVLARADEQPRTQLDVVADAEGPVGEVLLAAAVGLARVAHRLIRPFGAPRGARSPPADHGHDLDAVAVVQRGPAVLGAGDDRAVDLDRDLLGAQVLRRDEVRDGRARLHARARAVDPDLDLARHREGPHPTRRNAHLR